MNQNIRLRTRIPRQPDTLCTNALERVTLNQSLESWAHGAYMHDEEYHLSKIVWGSISTSSGQLRFLKLYGSESSVIS